MHATSRKEVGARPMHPLSWAGAGVGQGQAHGHVLEQGASGCGSWRDRPDPLTARALAACLGKQDSMSPEVPHSYFRSSQRHGHGSPLHHCHIAPSLGANDISSAGLLGLAKPGRLGANTGKAPLNIPSFSAAPPCAGSCWLVSWELAGLLLAWPLGQATLCALWGAFPLAILREN